jgi:FMN-dependent NADH-azoreductase
MPTLLQLDSSPLPGSVSRELTREFVAAWRAAHPAGTVISRDLAAAPPPPIDAAWIGASYTPEEALTPEQTETLALSDELVGELERADEYVIGVAMHNFSVPSVLRLWIDQIARKGRTFRYGADGPRGLLQGKKATVVIASGGVHAENQVEPYLRTVLGFVGVKEVTFVTAGGTARLQSGKVDRKAFLAPVVEQVRQLAA